MVKVTSKKQPVILLIDDDPDFVVATRTVLESNGYAVETADNGDSGLKKAREKRPDLIILDIIMPMKNGISACDELKRDPVLSKIPVLMLTSLAQKMGETEISRADVMSLDAEDYIDKPVAPEELLKRVAKLLSKPK
ncbi:MAG: response regulator [Dehalococcoidia bacterium]|nr:response regulator [Dehalococcoidia bacterium]